LKSLPWKPPEYWDVGGDIPMKCPRKNKVVVRRELEQAGVEFPLVDEPTGFVDNYEGINGPIL
jgi:hypothetical protein